jgi:hypothetical protein
MPRMRSGPYRPETPRQEAERVLRLHFANADGECAFCKTYALLSYQVGQCPPALQAHKLIASLNSTQ